METNFHIVPAMQEENTFFLFRDGIEVKFSSIKGIIKVIGRGYLLPKEVEYIKKFYI